MRRFVSVFSLKRDKHGHTNKDPSAEGPTHYAHSLPMGAAASKVSLLKPLAIPLLHPDPAHSPASSFSTPHLSSGSTDPSSHSSSSSNHSASLQDDSPSVGLTRTSTKRSWKAWIGKKRSGTVKRQDRKDKALPPDTLELPITVPPTTFVATDEDIKDHDVPSSSLARANFSLMIGNSLLRAPSQPSPFTQPSDAPIYPRSCNPPHALRRQPSLRVISLQKRLQQRLDDPSVFLEDPSILALASRPTPVQISVPTLPDCDIPYPDKSTQILASSPGLHRWICRPCFEDRFTIYLATEAGVQTKPVSSSFAVAALEYSEALDVMVDPDYELILDKVLLPSPSLPPAEAPSASTTLELAHVSSIEPLPSILGPSRNSHIVNPSPLRNQHTRAPSEASPSVDSIATIQSSSTLQEAVLKKPTTVSTAVKRVVRFAEDDDDEEDGMPLHLLRVKKKKEEKAKFLRMEQQRRMREAFEARKRQEVEMVERERKKAAMLKEKEERDRHVWAEQVAASRLRSEQSRAGAFSINSSTSSLLVPQQSHPREGERNLPRPSKAYSSKLDQASSVRMDDNLSSSGSSRPPSINYPVASRNGSRPNSIYSTTSSEDHRPSQSSRRDSYANSVNGSLRSMPGIYPAYPMWAGSNQSLTGMQMVPNFSSFVPGNDMPLLPPKAPFMRQSRQSLPPQPDPNSRRDSSHSNERGEPIRSSSYSSLSKSSSSSPSPNRSEFRPGHNRQSSGDSRNTSLSSNTHSQRGGAGVRQRPQATSSQSQQYISRGRPPLPSFQTAPQVPSPWTALPSRSGTLPTAMPVSSYSHPTQNRNSGFAGPMGHDWRSTLIS